MINNTKKELTKYSQHIQPLLAQPLASYRLALIIKQVLKMYNYIVCPLKLFVLILTRRVGGKNYQLR